MKEMLYIYKNCIGIIDGNHYTISNIKLTDTNGLIGNLYNKLKNLKLENIEMVDEISTYYYGGIVYAAHAGSTIDNVHIKNIEIIRKNQNINFWVGGIVSSCKGTISDSSVSNFTVKNSTTEAVSVLHVGGIAGRGENATIENCYSQNIEVSLQNSNEIYVGGIVGVSYYSGKIENCYAHGYIKTESTNVGGIIGGLRNDGIVKNCYSKVNISSQDTNIGGIIGEYSSSDINNISNNLSIGNIYSTMGIEAINRIIGNSDQTNLNNYSFSGQLLNGYVSDENKGATLLDEEAVLSFNLGDSYNYDGASKEILPKLYNTEETELLPNQEDIYLNDSDSEEVANLEIESTEAIKPNTTEAEISIRINNPNNVEITGITIEDMTSTIIRNVTQNGITSITLRATPNRYYDSYKLTEIKYKDKISEKELVKDVEAFIDVQFYKELYTFEDWQSIEENIYQNYKLMNDIDFSGKNNIKSNIKVNRLETNGNIYSLKNITLEFNGYNSGLINNVKKKVSNISFENITINYLSKSGSYCGLIVSSGGELSNIKFKNIEINAKDLNYVGLISHLSKGNVKNVNIDTIYISGCDYTGGLIGTISAMNDADTRIHDVIAKNATVYSEGNFIGGIFGYNFGYNIGSNDEMIENILIEESDVTGGSYVGGIIGHGMVKYSISNNNSITGKSYVGGIARKRL